MPHPRHLVAAGMIITNASDQVLMVQTFNRVGQGLILPGGMVEEDEAPSVAAAREVEEELGLHLAAEHLLAIEHRSPTNGRPSSLQFVFSADRSIGHSTQLRLQPDEIAEAHWVDHQNVVAAHATAGQARMAAALHVLTTGVTAYLVT